MENFGIDKYKFCALLLYNKAYNYDFEKIIGKLNEILYSCNNYKNDSLIDRIFKIYILTTDIDKTFRQVNNNLIKSRDDIIEVITYKQCSDKDINILAKIIYRKYGKFYHHYLDFQIDKLIKYQTVDSIQCYMEFKQETGKFNIPNILTLDL